MEKYDADKLESLRTEVGEMHAKVVEVKEQINTSIVRDRAELGDDAPEVKRLERWRRHLTRFESFAQLLETLELTASTDVDSTGRRSLHQQYEYSGASEGRLYAKSAVTIPNEKDGGRPRYANLQGMMSDLRAPLIGERGHDIDAVNSDFHLLLGMIERDGLEKLAPRVRQYVENPTAVRKVIMDKHRVDEDATKRLPNRLMNGGTYRAWLRANDLDEGCEKVKAMVDMQMEMGQAAPGRLCTWAPQGVRRVGTLAHPNERWQADGRRGRSRRVQLDCTARRTPDGADRRRGLL